MSFTHSPLHLACVALSLAAMFVPAHAAADSSSVLITPPLVAEGASVLDCYITNVSDRDRIVRIDALTRDGTVVNTFDVSLPPFTEKVVTSTSDTLARFCRFTVEGRPSQYRASILVREAGRGSISALPAQ